MYIFKASKMSFQSKGILNGIKVMAPVVSEEREETDRKDFKEKQKKSLYISLSKRNAVLLRGGRTKAVLANLFLNLWSG